MRSTALARPRRSIVLGVASLAASAAALAQSGDAEAFRQRMLEVLEGDIRTAEERARDPNRMPIEVLEFFGLRDDMRVIEILPAGGWYTKILGPLLKERGKLYVTHPPGFYADMFAPVADLPGLEAVEEIDWDATGRGSGGPFAPPGRWDVEPVDLVVTFRNYHNFSPEDRAALNRAVYDALEPGGHYGIVDHTRRHMEPSNQENRRRVDPVLVIKEVQDAGFVLVDFSDVLARPGDGLVHEVAHPEITDRTDRFTLLFRKPE